MKHRFRASLSYLLSLSFVLSSFSSYGEVPQALQPLPPSEKVTNSMFSFIPGWDDFAADQTELPKLPSFEKNDPILDQDPYFLRSQKWVQADGAVSETTTAADATGFDVQIPRSNVILHVEQPLTPVLEADDYIFLQANSPEFFRAKIKDEADYGEGLFFIDLRDLRAESLRTNGERRGVPIFFLMTDGKGWTEQLAAVQKRGMHTLDFRNPQGIGEAVDFGDLDDLSKILHFALATAVGMETLHQDDLVREKLMASLRSGEGRIEVPYILPPRGSTAAFGSFFTGIDLDHPSQSVGTLITSRFDFHRLWDMAFPPAYASGKTSLSTRLLIVSGFVVASFVGSYAAKKSVLRKRMSDIRKLIEDADDYRRKKEGLPAIDRTTARYRMTMGFVDTLTITTQVFATQEFLPTVSTGYFAEYLADKLPNEAGTNGFIRKYIVEKGLIFDRGQAEKVNANAWTFWLGSIVLGGLDIKSVIPQMFYLNQRVLPAIGGLFSDDLRMQMEHQYGGASAAGMNVLYSEMMRNVSSYTIHGAYSYSQEMVAFFETMVRPRIEDEVRHKQQIDPESQSGRKIVDELVRKEIEPLLVQRGLPSSDQHLFDASTMIKKGVQTRGYAADPKKLYPEVDMSAWSKDEINKFKKEKGEYFILENGRWGVLSRVLQNMVDTAQRFYELNPSETVAHALAYSKDVQAKFHKYKNWLSNPTRFGMVSREAKEIRQMLTSLSYLDDGPVFSKQLKYAHVWKGYTEDPDASELSARWFRQSLFATLEGKEYYLWPNEEQMRKFSEVALSEADTVLQAQGESYTEGDKKLLSIEIIKGKIAAEEHQKSVMDYRPYNKRFMDFDNGVLPVRWMGEAKTDRQLAQIKERAIEDVALQTKRPVEDFQRNPELIADPQIQPAYEDAFRNAWTDETALYTLPPQYSENVKKALDEAEETFAIAFSKEKLRYYYNSLSKADQVQLVARMKTEAFINAYTRQMGGAYANLSDKEQTQFLRSPEQPGFFQRFRMHSKWTNRPTRLARALNVVMRGLEMPFQTNYNLGAKAWRHRNVPWAGDHTTAWKNKFKRLFLLLTSSYLVNYYVWQVQYDWSTYLFLTLTFTYLSVFATSLDRMMMNIGKPTGTNTWRKAGFGEIWTWVTWPLAFPFFLFNKQFSEAWDKLVWNPLVEGATVVGSGASEGLHQALIACEKLLGGS